MISRMKQNEQSVDAGNRLDYSASQGPFYNANNIYMFYGGGNRGEIVEGIVHSVRHKEDIIHVHGEKGSGKTMLSLVASDRLKHQFHTIRYDHTEISAAKLLRYLLIELCPRQAYLISQEQAKNGAQRSAINAAIACISQQLSNSVGSPVSKKPYLLLIDCNKDLDAETLRVIDRLNQIQQNDRRVIHSIVFHPATQSTKSHSAVSSDSFQSDNHFWLRRLTLSEICEFLHHHMMLFDFNRRNQFTREMSYFIADRSEGVFRSVNTLARNALSIASLEDSDKLSMSHLLMAGLPMSEEVAIESRFSVRQRLVLIALISTCVVASSCAAFLLLN